MLENGTVLDRNARLIGLQSKQVHCKLRKSRARAILDVIRTSQAYHKGNLEITQVLTDEPYLCFSYRGTPIAKWVPQSGSYQTIDCGLYENTSSTRTQRRMIKEAIEEIEKGVFVC